MAIADEGPYATRGGGRSYGYGYGDEEDEEVYGSRDCHKSAPHSSSTQKVSLSSLRHESRLRTALDFAAHRSE